MSAVSEVAKLLVAAENPVMLADRAVRTAEGMKLLVELAETLQAPVVGGKFPSHHPLNQAGGRGLIANADVIVGMEVPDLWGTINTVRDQLHRSVQTFTKPGTKVVSISAANLISRVTTNTSSATRKPIFRSPPMPKRRCLI